MKSSKIVEKFMLFMRKLEDAHMNYLLETYRTFHDEPGEGAGSRKDATEKG